MEAYNINSSSVVGKTQEAPKAPKAPLRNPLLSLDIILANASPNIRHQIRADPTLKYTRADFMGLDDQLMEDYTHYLCEEGPVVLFESKRDLNFFRVFASTAVYLKRQSLEENVPVIWTIANHFLAHEKALAQEEGGIVLASTRENDYAMLKRRHDRIFARVRRNINTDYFIREGKSGAELKRTEKTRKFMVDYAMGVLHDLSFAPAYAIVTPNDMEAARAILYDVGNTDDNPGYFMFGYADERINNFAIYATYLNNVDTYLKSDDVYGLIDDVHKEKAVREYKPKKKNIIKHKSTKAIKIFPKDKFN